MTQPLPPGWQSWPIKHVATCNDDVLSENTSPEREMSYIDIGNVQHSLGVTGFELTKFASAPSRARRLVRDGDVIASTVRTYLRAIARIENPQENLVVSTGFAVLRPGPLLSSRFFGYAMQCERLVDEIVARSNGVSYPAIAASDLVRLRIRLPDRATQDLIVNILDGETAKADALIAKYERLIELLEEKRVALITQTVTRGLDATVQMVNSRVEWIGVIPENWSLQPLKRVSHRLSVGIVIEPSKYFSAFGLPFVHGNNIGNGNLLLDDVKTISETDSLLNRKSRLHTGDLVTMRVGEPGRTAVVTAECEGGNCASVILIKGHESFDSTWLRFAMNCRAVRTQIERNQNGSAQQVLNVSEAMNLLIPTPSRQEQGRIAEALIVMERDVVDAKNLVRKAKELVIEHRSALITAAVTGQIDVSTYRSKKQIMEAPAR